MALERRSKIDKIEILEDGQLQIRRLNYVADAASGDLVAEIGYHREVVPVHSDLTAQPARVKAIAAAVWPKA